MLINKITYSDNYFGIIFIKLISKINLIISIILEKRIIINFDLT